MPGDLHRTQVCIVGCGPVGLFLALQLHQAGINATVVDRQKSRYPLPRAVAMDHESQRMLGMAGIYKQVDAILEHVVDYNDQSTNYCWRDADEKVIVDMQWQRGNASGLDAACGFSQPQFEAVLEMTAKDRGIEIMRSQGLVSVEQDEDHVTAHFGHWTITDVGCDGANSAVRGLLDIKSVDLGFQYDWLISDFLLKDGYVPPRVKKIGAAQICDPKRPTTVIFGGPGRKRLEFMLLEGESKEEMLQDKTVWNLAKAWGYDPSNTTLERKAIYTFGARWAKEFYRGRVIMAGDAIHLMPPFIGQGLNSGLRDATALAWRLHLILNQGAPVKPLLDSYHKERSEHVENLTRHSVMLGEVVCERDPAKAIQIHKALRSSPPKNGYDPALGRPGIFTDQKTSGHLAIQRKVTIDGRTSLFDAALGYGWTLLTCSAGTITEQLSPGNLDFYATRLRGRFVQLTAEQDSTGAYRHWLDDVIGQEVVLIRPDFYIFGSSSLADVNSLLSELQTRMGKFGYDLNYKY